MLAGHVSIGNNVVMSGGAASHHYVSIGDFAFIAGLAQINMDVPPFVKLRGKDKVKAVNTQGLRRAGVAEEDIEEIEDALRKLFFNREKPTFAAALAEVDMDSGANPRVKQLVDFLRRRDIGKHGRFLESTRPPQVKTPPQ
jgi:UDP-N-acetylglucosamine acyltransferase